MPWHALANGYFVLVRGVPRAWELACLLKRLLVPRDDVVAEARAAVARLGAGRRVVAVHVRSGDRQLAAALTPARSSR